jgi:hypothetical protein
MNWYQQNRWLGNFMAAFSVGLVLTIWFLFYTRAEYSKALAQFKQARAERNRLEHLNPFPSQENFSETEAGLENYRASLDRVVEELKSQVAPSSPLAPNEFQSRLRQTIVAVTETAQRNRVKLPENFHLGFDEFTTALPESAASSLLAQQLAQIELLLEILIHNRVDEITGLRRPHAPTGSPAGSMVVDRSIVEIIFKSSPLVQRKVLNQIASSERQIFVVRALHVRNERQDAPSREQASAIVSAAASPSAIKFIVGTEHVETAASVELVRLSF